MKKSTKIILIIMVVAVTFLGITYGPGVYTYVKNQFGTGPQQKILYHCPMHPTYIADKPGDCPICGMRLVPIDPQEHEALVDTGTSSAMSAGVQINPQQQQTIGVKTGTATVIPFNKSIKAVGTVDYNEQGYGFINTKFEGWIEKLYINTTGEFITKGQPVFEIYSSELVAAQQEYLLALKNKKGVEASGYTDIKASADSLLAASRKRLRLWDISDRQIDELETTGEIRRAFTIYSSADGFVIEKNVIEGQKVMAGESLLKIADLSTVWILGEIYEYDLALIKTGQMVNITFPSYSGTVMGEVDYIYPYINNETRTNKIRIISDNPELILKPEMYADLEILVDYGLKLAVPASAVIYTGNKTLVFIDEGNGYFQPREVELGVENDDYVEVISGLKKGEKIVLSANFLIDSESNLKSAISQMTGDEPVTAEEKPKPDEHAGHR